jgi:hypothetical protein
LQFAAKGKRTLTGKRTLPRPIGATPMPSSIDLAKGVTASLGPDSSSKRTKKTVAVLTT